MLYRNKLVGKGNYQKPSGDLHEYRMSQNLKNSINLSESQNIEKTDEKFRIKSNIVNKKIEDAKKLAHNSKMNKDLRESYLLNTLYEIFDQGLPLDEEFKEEHRQSLKEVFSKEVSHLSDSAEDLLKNMSNSKSEFLQEMAKEIKNEANADSEKVTNGKKSKEELKDKAIKNYDTNQASILIKNKVMKVIKKENEISEREKQIEDDLNNLTNVSESGAQAFYQNQGAKQYRLFRAIMINSYKKAINKVTNLNEKSNMLEQTKDGLKMDTDKLLAESIIKYTILETFNTIGLKSFTPNEVKALSNKLAYTNYK